MRSPLFWVVMVSVVIACAAGTFLLGRYFGPAGTILGIGLSGIVGAFSGAKLAEWENR